MLLHFNVPNDFLVLFRKKLIIVKLPKSNYKNRTRIEIKHRIVTRTNTVIPKSFVVFITLQKTFINIEKISTRIQHHEARLL